MLIQTLFDDSTKKLQTMGRYFTAFPSPSPCCTLEYRGGSWFRVNADLPPRPCAILPETRVMPWLIIAHFRYLDEPAGVGCLRLWQGSGISGEDLRRIRSLLRWRGIGDETKSPVPGSQG